MKKGDVVKFKGVVDMEDADLRMILMEDPENGWVRVKVLLVHMENPPTYIYRVEDLELA